MNCDYGIISRIYQDSVFVVLVAFAEVAADTVASEVVVVAAIVGIAVVVEYTAD